MKGGVQPARGEGEEERRGEARRGEERGGEGRGGEGGGLTLIYQALALRSWVPTSLLKQDRLQLATASFRDDARFILRKMHPLSTILKILTASQIFLLQHDNSYTHYFNIPEKPTIDCLATKGPTSPWDPYYISNLVLSFCSGYSHRDDISGSKQLDKLNFSLV